METNNSLKFILKKSVEILNQTTPTPLLDAEILISFILRQKKVGLYLNFEKKLSKTEIEKIENAVLRRKKGEPVAYIINEKPFFNQTFFVDSRVLIPRPETELLVEKALELLQKKKLLAPEILDICCGSGCVGLSIFEFFSGNLVLSDISQDALDVAKINAKNLFGSKIDSVSFVKSDLFEKIEGKFDLITANPPYLSQKDMEIFGKNLKYEPSLALLGGKTGIEITKRIIFEAFDYLNKEGYLLVELGFEGAKFIESIKTQLNFIGFIKDYQGVLRHAIWKKN